MKSFDFQVHSRFSFDSWNSIKDIKNKALKEGLNGVAITDHESFDANNIAKKHNNSNFIFVPGQEINTEFGDIIALFISKKINTNQFHEVIKEIRQQNGVVYLPHPARKLKLTKEMIKNNIDVVEAVNGRSNKDENKYSAKLALDLDIPFAGGSDAHTLREIGKVKTIFSKGISNLEELQRMLLDKSISRRIVGSGKYSLLNNFQSSLIGTMKTGKIKDFARGISKKLIK